MRINFSHATYEEALLRVTNLNQCFGINHPQSNAATKMSNMRAIMLDTQGPEIRTGSFPEGTKNVQLETGQMVTLSIHEDVRYAQSVEKLWISYHQLLDTVEVGSSILLDDGAVELRAVEMDFEKGEVTAEVMNTGVLGNKKGVNLPGLPVLLPPMSHKDKEDIRWGLQHNVDFIAASFVRSPKDITEIREYCEETLRELFPSSGATGAGGSGPDGFPQDRQVPHIISKIENVESLVNFDSILEVSDGIMVARGDLAVEIPMESIANVQKEIVRRCNQAGKPVIVATQMMDSMQKNPRPTRAECTDVANAVFDGADCVMLSGESAQGKYPVETVGLMKRIVDQSELAEEEYAALAPRTVPDLSDPVEAMAYAVVQAAHGQRSNEEFACIVVMMSTHKHHSATLAKHISKFRPQCPIVCIVPTHKGGRLLQIYRGIHPVLMLPETDRSESSQVLLHLRKLGMVDRNSQALLVHHRSSNLDIQVELCTV